ncbi:MAG: DNA oxidative demethylase AlkB [Proteobacteria bacterium]|nr:DNA oxidative demethylase AlkB [Pseudomonadota bacterium]MBS0494978.1 DNA oxidative demethylase AlkB [Pseudomonadota bacterium]
MPQAPADDLFANDPAAPQALPLGAQAVLLRGFALAQADALVQCVQHIATHAPWRHMQTPGGQTMSVAMTGCGPLSWISDRRGYRYAAHDPLTGQPWPAMPQAFLQLAQAAAQQAGFAGFQPDACLINRYAPGARMSLHQDRDERDMDAPIVSVSLGLPAMFLWGGATRAERPLRVPLQHGDVVVWGGVDRLRFHGVLPLAPGAHPTTGDCRINLTFRKAR